MRFGQVVLQGIVGNVQLDTGTDALTVYYLALNICFYLI